MYNLMNLTGNATTGIPEIASFFDLTGKTAMITGAAMGIGQMMAVALAGAGAKVALLDIADTTETQRIIEGNGKTAAGIYCDLAKISQTKESIIRQVNDLFGPISILVNCGGITFRSPAIDYPEDKFFDVVNINLISVFILSQAVARQMKENGGGKIINMASALSFQGGKFVPAYAASKGGVAQLTKAMSNEWSEFNINVNAIAPGSIDTALNKSIVSDPMRNKQVLDRLPCGRWGKPSDFMGTVVYLASRASDYVTGHILCVDGGYQGR